MQPSLMIALAALVGVPLGVWLHRDLATLGYRNEDEQDLPPPGPRRWVTWTSVLALSSLAAAASLSGRAPIYLPLLPLAAAGPWLAAVDVDVLRIPNRVVGPTALATLLAIGGMAAATQDWRALIVPCVAAVVTGGVLAAVHFATKGGIGFGDVKLAALIALGVGPLGVGAVWLSILTGSLSAVVWARATRRIGPVPYGPWLLVEAWGAGLAAASLAYA